MAVKPENKMDFEQIKQNKDEFLKTYGIEDIFEKSGLSWEELMEIGEEYAKKSEGDDSEYRKITRDFIIEFSKFKGVHSYRYRIKEVDSFLVKVIRKCVEKGKKITKENYLQEITDIIGLRILYVFKEDYLLVHEQIMDKYKDRMAENVHLKLRSGDNRSIYDEIIKRDGIFVEENASYRSIHYTIYPDTDKINLKPKIEIQTRTIFEEGWSEIDHRLVYKKTSVADEKLRKATEILSGLVGNCDSVGSFMKWVYEEATKNRTVELTGNSDPSVKDDTDDTVGELLKRFLMN